MSLGDFCIEHCVWVSENTASSHNIRADGIMVVQSAECGYFTGPESMRTVIDLHRIKLTQA